MNQREELEVCRIIVGLTGAAYRKGRADEAAKEPVDENQFHLTGGRVLQLKKLIADRLKKR